MVPKYCLKMHRLGRMLHFLVKKKSYHKCKHFVNWSAGHMKGRVPNPKCGILLWVPLRSPSEQMHSRKSLELGFGSVSSQATSETPGTVPTMVGHLPRLLSPLWASCLNSTLITGFPVYSLPFYPNIIAGTQKGKKKIHVSTALHSWPSWEPLPGNVLLPPKGYFPNVNMAKGSMLLPLS